MEFYTSDLKRRQLNRLHFHQQQFESTATVLLLYWSSYTASGEFTFKLIPFFFFLTVAALGAADFQRKGKNIWIKKGFN